LVFVLVIGFSFCFASPRARDLVDDLEPVIAVCTVSDELRISMWVIVAVVPNGCGIELTSSQLLEYPRTTYIRSHPGV
jgi:hypothetical protein